MTIFRSINDSASTSSDRSAGDRKRHRDKVRGALKDNLGHIISEEAIIGQSGDKKIKVPIKGSRSTGSSLALTAMERPKELEKSRLETLFNKDRRRVQVLEEVLEATLVRTSMKLRLPWTN